MNKAKQKIKLFQLDKLPDGTTRLQSQLYIGKQTADFIRDKEGQIMNYTRGANGFNFYPYNEPIEIVTSKTEMIFQAI